MKKYKLTDNISFLASVMRQASKASFVFVLLRIPLEVIIPYIGIWFPNLIVRAIEESVNRTHLFTQAAILGGLLVVLSLVNQYGKGIVSAESAYVRMKLTDMLNDHLMDCSYDMLGDKKVMQSLSQASQRIWSNTGFLVNAGENTVAFFSAVAGVVVYLAVLSKLQKKIGSWMRTAIGVVESSHIRVMRVADNMRNVAVTEGDKVEAQLKFGWEIDAYPVNEIAESVAAVSESDTNALVDEYYSKYNILLEGRDPAEFRKHVAVQAQIELGFERFLEEKNYQAIVTHFGDLGALKQLPGLAIQRLMEKGYGFGAEGDWKVAAMVRLMKIMTSGMKDAKGTSMLEDYTYNLVPGKEGILEAHMLEICPSIADGPISIKCQPLSMGDREDPARLVFTSKEGTGIATSLVDLGDRFRLLINTVDCKKVEKPMPKLPVATNFWTPQPDLITGAEAWILAGGAHHTAFTYDLTAEQMGDWAEAMGIEPVYIDNETTIRNLKKDLMLGNLVYRK